MTLRTLYVCLCVLLTCMPTMAGGEGDNTVVLGAERTEQYAPMLRGKRVALFSNHTGIVPDGRHTLDVMLDAGIDVRMLYAPEHGFRGTADAGAKVSDATDERTGLPVRSLYGAGKQKALSPAALKDIDVIVCDIQDVGLRYYTYYITMAELMEAAAANGKEFVVFDRPNPNGMTVDGQSLDPSLRSGVGRFPMPVKTSLSLWQTTYASSFLTSTIQSVLFTTGHTFLHLSHEIHTSSFTSGYRNPSSSAFISIQLSGHTA